ncbi:tRNA synthetases class I-domain-containing protein [Cantharellus anzutake]|uniref:tRNA synthetases class I-domain-containing protein n=1 Tax=Cantharellus anzutake TaxID=1750568 RepID=UPI001908DA3B|nr:tRNA synthetases class I-domain-containing protein [Cantharellus anzutake]KAF8337423.1 tRNA synthetases class I-domain-containing protein [Cantharellus anzutake]
MSTQNNAANPSNAPDPNSKSAAKKEAKRLEALAKKATKLPKQAAEAVTSGEKKKSEKAVEKASKKEEEEPFVNTTPRGEKKDLSKPMASGYNPIAVESAWYDWWEKEGFFAPSLTTDGDVRPEGSFVVAFPPPNVTGSLHIGHGLTVAIQDALIRWNRMHGKTTLWSVVEKRLYKSTGKTRHDLGREKFLEQVLEWKNDYQERITKQMKRLGGSFDWSRVAFTMNKTLSAAVVETFCRLSEEGIIYRANRLVNWCVQLNTTLSNLEVDQKKVEGRTLLNVPGYDIKEKFEFGVITSFAYHIENTDEKIIVATTRPETMLGDTAVAVHPDDPRYKHLHGKVAIHPFIPDRRIPIVTDAIAVDMEFGTGAVKITPAHDPNDYDVGIRHNLEFINILNDDGTLNENAGRFKGLKRFHARNAVVEALKAIGDYVETKDNPMNIPVCSKSGDVVEPVMKPQWWVNCKPLAEEAIKRTKASEVRIAPKASENEWYRWLEGIQDWCISRQLWWGHRVPAYFVNVEGEVQDRIDDKNWVVGRTVEEAAERAKLVARGKPFTLEQDEDVLDTWFSSGLWPFSTQGWPAQTEDLARFYPTSLLETGWDILFFWVARMVMLGIRLTNKVPFEDVYCHAMIRDAHGRKMSKSLGNVIDPLDVIQGISLEDLHKKLSEGNLDEKEIAKAKAGQKKDFPKGIPQCGTDALRFALCAYTSGGRDINLEILRVEGYRKFCNKLWNATKFAMLKFEEGWVPELSHQPTGKESLAERWILHKLNIAVSDLNKQLADRSFLAATGTVYNFWLYELCDVFIEAMKPMTDEKASLETRRSAQNTLYTCLDFGLRLLHPFMPFVTEELWQRLPRRPGDNTPSIMVSSFPVHNPDFVYLDAERDFDTVFAAIKAVRSLAAQYNLQTNIQAIILSTSQNEHGMLASQAPTIGALSKGCKSANVVADSTEVPTGCGSVVLSPTATVFVLVKGLVDLDAEITKCEKKLNLANLNAEKIRKLKAQPGYEQNIPADVRASNDEKLSTYEAETSNLQESIGMFKRLK